MDNSNFKSVAVCVDHEKEKISIPEQVLIDLIDTEMKNGRICDRSFSDNDEKLNYIKSMLDQGIITPHIFRFPLTYGDTIIDCTDIEICKDTICSLPLKEAIKLNIDHDMRDGIPSDAVCVGLTVAIASSNTNKNNRKIDFKKILSYDR